MGTKLDIKYVIIGNAIPIIFIVPKHKDMKVYGEVTSAAFFKIVNGRVETYGHSVSLGMWPNPDDAKIIEHFLGLS